VPSRSLQTLLEENGPLPPETVARIGLDVLSALDVDLETLVVDNREYDDIYRAFMLAGVPDIEAPTDIGFMATLYRAAEKHGRSTVVLTIVAGPLNYFGLNPQTRCEVPQPSQ